jgi:hypothetical protein
MQNLRSLQSGHSESEIVSLEVRRVEAVRRSIRDQIADVAEILAQNDRDQLARDIADIESATAVLLKGEPALRAETESTAETMVTVAKPGPIWTLIAALWFSTALIAAGAVVAVATLVG